MSTLGYLARRGPTSVNAGRTEDFNDELYDALKGSKSGFSGSFYHCSTAPNAPNPGLRIEGVGGIGLPLSQRDAAAIISRAAQAPFGRGTETVVDPTVRDTWEIDPGSVSFLNPQWAAFVDGVATKQVWTALGVAPFTTRPRCELYKLLLYQPGGHFLPHQDTLKSDGMFATIIIVLPSEFEGGEVHVSHAGQSKVLDVSQNSHFSTTILAWYTDVLHEVKPVTSGYRLALSYNLIHTSPNTPQPALPRGGILSSPLGLCLQKWKNGAYTTMPSNPLAVYLLDHEYSTDDLDEGQKGLKGKDAQMAAQLLLIAERLGFVVGVANITRHATGSADDYGGDDYRYNKRARHEVYDVTQPQKRNAYNFADIQEDEYKILHYVRIDEGEREEDAGLGNFIPDKSCFVPKTMFRGVSPHREEYEGYMGNYAGKLEQWYRHSVLILFRSEDSISVGISANGVDWALDQLQKFKSFEGRNHPTAKLIVSALLANVEQPVNTNPRRLPYQQVREVRKARDPEAERRCAQSLLACAVKWKQQALWNRAIPHCGPALDGAATSIAEALQVFDLESIKPSLALLVQQSLGLHTRFAVINAIANKVGTTENDWLESLTRDALSSYEAAAIADIPTLVQIAEGRGADVIVTRILPKIPQTGTYDFLVALTRALSHHSSTQSSREKKAELRTAIYQCVHAAARQCPHSPTSNQLTGLVDVCFEIGEPTLCSAVLQLVSPEATSSALTDFAKTLHKNLANTVPSDNARATLCNLARKAVQSAISRWEVGLRIPVPPQPANFQMLFGRPVRALPGPPPSVLKPDPWLPNVKTNRICELVELIFSLDEPSLFTTLLNTLLHLPTGTDIETRFKEVYTPLIAQLKGKLAEHATTVTTEPFASFFKRVVSLYLVRILGPLTPRYFSPSLPAIDAGCNACIQCKQLHTFVNDGSPELRIRAVQNIRTHVENEIAVADVRDRVWTETITDQGTPYTLVVSKRGDVVEQLAWRATQEEAILFLAGVGDDAELRAVMGEKYQQTLWAVNGERVFN